MCGVAQVHLKPQLAQDGARGSNGLAHPWLLPPNSPYRTGRISPSTNSTSPAEVKGSAIIPSW